MKTIREDILNKIVEYDNQHETYLSVLLSGKVNGNPNREYSRGIVHGMCLALTNLGIITNEDALDILDLIREE